jgi:hypothetical protein
MFAEAFIDTPIIYIYTQKIKFYLQKRLEGIEWNDINAIVPFIFLKTVFVNNFVISL